MPTMHNADALAELASTVLGNGEAVRLKSRLSGFGQWGTEDAALFFGRGVELVNSLAKSTTGTRGCH